MSKAKFNYRRVAEKVAASPVGLNRVQKAMDAKFEIAKDKLINDFENHVISREINISKSAPENDNNISQTLGGVGNLFSFIGFNYGEDPIGEVSSILKEEMVLARPSKGENVTRGNSPRIRYRFSARVPRESLEEATQMNWQPVSWLYAIERGISGLTHYIRGAFPTPPSLSGGGLQTKKNAVRSIEYQPPKQGYFNALLRNFVSYFKSL